MSFTRNAGRFAGLLYILASIPGVFALVYVPSKLIVRGNATATAHNIVVSETLFRLGIAADLICQALFSFVASSVRRAQGRQPAARLGHGDFDSGLNPDSVTE